MSTKIDNGSADDGWNNETAIECGLMDAMEMSRQILNELENCRRGSSGLIGTVLNSLLDGLGDLRDHINDVIEELEE